MKRFIYILFFLIGLIQGLFAQHTDNLDAKRLDLRLEADFVSFVPCGKEWFQVQKDAWKVEIDKNPRNERAWENYCLACKGIWEEKRENEEGDTLQRKKEQLRLLEKMKKYIPDTRAYYRLLLDKEVTPDEKKREVIEDKIVTLKRESESDYRDDMWYYHRRGRIDKMKELAREWFDSGLYSQNILYYCYNEFVGLKKNAVFAGARYQWNYCMLLQYGMGLFKDVEMVDLNELMSPDSESEFWRAKGVDVQTLPDKKDMECPGGWYFTEKEKRPVYIAQNSVNRQHIIQMKDMLYSEGLVFRYSLKPYDNMAVMRRNYEQVYLLDYLRSPIITDSFRNEDCYVLAFLPLLQFYHTSGDKNQYIRLRRLLLGIVDRMGNNYFENRAGINTEMAERLKLVKTIFNHVKEMEKSGKTSVVVLTFEEEYWKEYQQLINSVEP